MSAESFSDTPLDTGAGRPVEELLREEATPEQAVSEPVMQDAGHDGKPPLPDHDHAAEISDAVDLDTKVPTNPGTHGESPAVISADSAEVAAMDELRTQAQVQANSAPAPAAMKPVPSALAAVDRVPTLTLIPSFVSKDLVTLRRDGNSMTASYERVAGKILTRPWSRTSVFFTSTQPNEGSTSVAVNVATMLSRRAESTLLVELQLTEPSLWSLFGRPTAATGFEEALRGRAQFQDCLYKLDGEKLDVLLVKEAMSVEEAGHLSGVLNDFLEWAEERFAWLVVDCPPVLAASWTKWFDLNADPVVLVAARSRAKKHELRKVAHRLGDRLSGTILNECMPERRAS